MGEGRSSEIREMTHRAEEVEGGGGVIGLQSKEINFIFCPGFCLWYKNFHFVLCAVLASWEDVVFSIHYFSFCKHYLMKYNRFCNLQ